MFQPPVTTKNNQFNLLVIEHRVRYPTNITFTINFFFLTFLFISQFSKRINNYTEKNIDQQNVYYNKENHLETIHREIFRMVIVHTL